MNYFDEEREERRKEKEQRDLEAKKKIRLVKIISIPLVTTLFLLVVGISSCVKIPVGHEGVVVTNIGNSKGVQEEVLKPGYNFVRPGKSVYKYPTFTIAYPFTGDRTEGSENNERFYFSAAGGAKLGADIGIELSTIPGESPKIYEKYMKTLDVLKSTVIKNMIRDSLTKHAPKFTVEELLTPKKMVLLSTVEEEVKAQAAEIGIAVYKMYYIGRGFEMDSNLSDAIKRKITAKQLAEEKTALLNAEKKETDIKVEKADAARREKEKNADALAYEITKRANAKAEANKTIRDSITPILLEYKKLEVMESLGKNLENSNITTLMVGSDAQPIIPLD